MYIVLLRLILCNLHQLIKMGEFNVLSNQKADDGKGGDRSGYRNP